MLPNSNQADARLVAVVAAWDSLSDEVKAKIMAMVSADACTVVES
jgi:hypothetical protein